MEPTWEAVRWTFAGASAGVWGFFSFINLLMTAVRYIQRRRASSVPLVGSAFGLLALVVAPVGLSWWAVCVLLIGLVAVEILGCLWPADLHEPPAPDESRVTRTG